MARGCPKKKARNTTGLHNNQRNNAPQHSNSPSIASLSSLEHIVNDSTTNSPSIASLSSLEHIVNDSTTINEDLSDDEDSEDTVSEFNWDDMEDEEFGRKLADMALEDDPGDEDWIPPKLKCSNLKKKVSMSFF
ncbi:hypothetical protein BDQ17DRAFT_1434329 [Cyathus striatus]|nr:hypothetical protein BDQ17DRAFT_1434329 [Cyathus striatus]